MRKESGPITYVKYHFDNGDSVKYSIGGPGEHNYTMKREHIQKVLAKEIKNYPNIHLNYNC